MKRDLPPAPPLLEVVGLHKHFTLHLRGGLRLPVLGGVDLAAHAGECLALVGPSGRGKSTLMKCLYGSYRIDGGQVWMSADGGRIDLATATPQQVIDLRRRDIAYVSQFLRALPRLPAIDVVAERWLGAHDDGHAIDDEQHALRLAEARARAAALFERLRLPQALWSLPPSTFSGGEQQRVNIARGFVQPARLLLLDEPTASLDAANRRIVIGLIDEAKAQGSTVIGIFHDEEVRDAVTTRCVELGAGG